MTFRKGGCPCPAPGVRQQGSIRNRLKPQALISAAPGVSTSQLPEAAAEEGRSEPGWLILSPCNLIARKCFGNTQLLLHMALARI